MTRASSDSVFRRLLPYLRPYGKQIAFGLGCLLLAIPANNFHPLVWMFVVNEVIGNRRVEMLLPALGAMFLVQAFGTVLGAWRTNVLDKVGQRLVFDLRNRVYEKVQGQSLEYLHERRAGDLLSRVMNDIDVLQEVAVQGTDALISNGLAFLFVAGVLITLHPVLGVATLLPIALVFLLTRYFNAKVKALYRETRDRLGEVSARLQENLTGLALIKAFAKEPYESGLFREATREYMQTNYRAINARTLFFPAVHFVGFISNLLSIGLGAWLVLQGRFTVGGLVAYRGYWWPLFAPINQLATINEMLQRAQAAGSRVFEILDDVETVSDAPDAQELRLTEGRVEFRNVSFAYHEKPVLQDVSFTAYPGEVVALVGPSGAGKTTVLNLLPRFYDPKGGGILIDGQEIREVTQASLRRHMALVQQETFLFNRSVLENLRYGKPEATMEEVEAAARAANAWEFLNAMPNGLATEIGERGVKLSGGQRQRLSIARAFLADPEILILDEPTSSVEPESEWIIQQALERLMKGRTTFITSHRFSIVRGADRILVFNEGRLVEEGRHKALLDQGGLYADMYRRQMGEELPFHPRDAEAQKTP
ncbi:MAG: ABC transporter ATP-binding protein/permease [Armatimonadetes bacterium]|nr:ABC transporter ATP-binding protein/permease [Armatimonadota bacterium]